MTIGPDDALAGLPAGLRNELLKAYDDIVKHYRAGRWEPSELNGGKFCELVYCVLRGYVDGRYPTRASKPPNMVAACLAMEHAPTTFSRTVRIQIPRMLMPLYEIRNNRNVGHVGGDVDPNHMDALCVLGMSRWILAELVRVFHSIPTEEATAVVESLTTRESAAIWEIGGQRRVLSSDLSARDGMLLLAYGAAGSVLDSTLLEWLEYSNASRFRKEILGQAHRDRLIEYNRTTGSVTLSPLGSRYVEEHLPLHIF